MSLKEIPASRLPIRARGRFAGWLAVRIRDLSVWSDIRAFPPLAVWGGVHCVAAMLLVRRSAGVPALKFTSTQICVTATVVAVLVVAARAMLARVERRPPAVWLRLVAAVASAAPIVTLCFGSAKRLPLGSAAFLGMLTFVVGVATWLWDREFVERLLTSFLLSPSGEPAVAAPGLLAGGGGHGAAESQRRDPVESLRLKRMSPEEGRDRLEGVMTAEFIRGQTMTTLHVPFLPTFPRSPEFVCEIDDKAAVRIKGTAVYPYGCRLELKRSGEVSESIRVEVRFSATLTSSSRAA